MWRKGAIKKTKRVSEQLIPCREKRRRLSPCNQSKIVETGRSFSPFQNGRPFSVKARHTGGRLELNTKSRTKLAWRIENLRYCNGGTSSQLNPQMIIQTDTSLTEWGVVCNRVQTSGQWSKEERTLHINVLVLPIKFALFSFTKEKRVKAIHFQIDNKAALPYLSKTVEAKIEYIYDQFKQRDLVLSSKS